MLSALGGIKDGIKSGCGKMVKKTAIFVITPFQGRADDYFSHILTGQYELFCNEVKGNVINLIEDICKLNQHSVENAVKTLRDTLPFSRDFDRKLGHFHNVQKIRQDPETPAHKFSKLARFYQDIHLVVKRLVPFFTFIFMPIDYISLTSGRTFTKSGLNLQLVLTLVSILMVLFLGLFGLVFVGAAIVIRKHIEAEEGAMHVTSTTSNLDKKKHANESWIFINGICTSRAGVELTLDRLEAMFRRPVLGLHSRSFGPLFDILACALQRDINFNNFKDIHGYKEVKAELEKDAISKVVLIGHSRGGISISSIVDKLCEEYGRQNIRLTDLRKLEVYTFASAANHFNNPIAKDDKHPIFNHVEHFVNGKDPVARIGVLAYSESERFGPEEGALKTSYNRHSMNGLLFIRKDNCGHMLLKHYLDDGACILDSVEAGKHSQLQRYRKGGI